MAYREKQTPGTQSTFGFQTIDVTERQDMVNRVFSSVANRYDLMNDLMSGGLHRLWKDELVSQINPPKSTTTPFRLLDVAGGTGDVAMRTIKRGSENCTAVICDISQEMLEVGRKRVNDANLSQYIDIIEGNAENLPFGHNEFNAYTISFGIRNVTQINVALDEAYRVLKPGGHFLCLEFSKVDLSLIHI